MPIRLRLALSFGAVTMLLVVVGGILFASSFRRGLEHSLEPGLRSQLHAVVGSLESAPASTATVDDPVVLPAENLVFQVLDANGKVLVSTRETGAAGVVPQAVERAAMTDRVFTNVRIGREREPHRVLVAPVDEDASRRVVVVGTSLEPTDRAVSRVRSGLLRGGAAAVAFAGMGGWLLASAALRPVERMRRTASEISEHDAAARLQVPSTRDEISALALTMNTLLERLHGALARQRAFVADASHELRTPLAVLQTELELAARPDRTMPELREAIAHATREVDRLARLVHDLLLLARRDGRSQLSVEDTLVRSLLEEAIAATRPLAEGRGIGVVLRVDPELRAALTPTLVRHAIVNLLTNAIDHSAAGGTIVVDARPDDDVLVVEVLDEGPGFPPEFLPEAFERFRRADESRTRRDGGAGLGLAIVRAVADAHGGTADAANRPQGGAVVTLRLPRAGSRDAPRGLTSL